MKMSLASILPAKALTIMLADNVFNSSGVPGGVLLSTLHRMALSLFVNRVMLIASSSRGSRKVRTPQGLSLYTYTQQAESKATDGQPVAIHLHETP